MKSVKRMVTLLMAISMFFVLMITSSGCSLFISGAVHHVEKTYINEGWDMARVPDVADEGSALSTKGYAQSGSWFDATVPGTVLTSYHNAGLIPDPYYSDNMLALDEDYYNVDYWYRNEFTVPTEYEGRRIWLNFDGINWKADVFVNGKSVGKIEGAFIRGQFDITDYVTVGEVNTVAVYIHWCDSGVKEMPSFLCSNSWDWMPAIPGRNMGIYKDVYLSASGDVTLVDPFIKTDLNEPKYNKAKVTIETEVQNHTDKKISGSVTGTIRPKDGKGKVYKFSKNVSIPANETAEVVIDNITMKDPELWWPNGLGDPNLYTMNIYFKAGSVSDAEDVVFGVREFSFEYEEDKTVEGNTPTDDMVVSVNGEKVYCRGGNWGIPESMLNWTDSDFENAIRLSAEEGFTMIRCWHGTSDFDAFYKYCDEYGIMVTDEFWLNGPEVPKNKTMFMDNARDKIRRLRNHACLAFWIGANEITPPGGLDNILMREIGKLDGTRPYISASNSEELTGGITYKINDLEWYFTNGRNIGFTTEYGCVNIWNVESLRNFFEEEDLDLDDVRTNGGQKNYDESVWQLHEAENDQYGNKGFDAYVEQIYKRYGAKNSELCKNIDDLCRNAQYLNYETFKAMFESWNVNMFKEENGTSGTLLWMSQQGWPGVVWSTYDYYMEENGAFFGCKSANEAVHVQYNYATGEIQVINNSLKAYKNAKVTAEIYNMDGSLVHTESESIDFEKTSVKESFNLFTGKAKLKNNGRLSSVYFIRLKLTDEKGNLLSENNYWRGKQSQNYASLKDLGDATYSVSNVDKKDDGTSTVITFTVKNESANLAFGTRVKMIRDNAEAGKDNRILPTFYSDNYFYLLPGESKTITVEYENEYLYGGNAQISLSGLNVAEQVFNVN